MAVPDSVVAQVGQQIRFLVSGDYSPADPATDYSIGVPTDVLLTQASLADGAGRQSDKVDLGESRALSYEVLAAEDFTGETPVSGEVFEYYWLGSTSTTQANGNVGGNSGADGAAPDGALGAITLAEFIALGALFIGNLRIHDGAVVQNGYVGVVSPTNRYGQLLVVNESGDVVEADNIDMCVWMTPINTVIIE